MLLELEKRTRLHFEDGDHTILDFLCDWTAGGRTLTKLARELSNALDLEIGVEQLTRWLYRTHDRADVVARLAEAREQGAHAMVGHALDDAEGITDKDQASVIRVRNDARFWTATRFNRRELGEQKAGVQINLSVGSLHLDAMRQRSVEAGHEGATPLPAGARSLVCHNDTGADPAIASAIDADYTIVSADTPST